MFLEPPRSTRTDTRLPHLTRFRALGESEAVLGRAIRDFAPRREDVVLATKVFNPMGDGANDRGLSRKHILASIDASLKRLGTDSVDLYIIHRRSDEHTSELQSLMRISYSVFCLKKKNHNTIH